MAEDMDGVRVRGFTGEALDGPADRESAERATLDSFEVILGALSAE